MMGCYVAIKNNKYGYVIKLKQMKKLEHNSISDYVKATCMYQYRLEWISHS